MEFTKENILGVFGDFRRGQLSFDNLEKEIMDLDDTPEKIVVLKFVAEFYENNEDCILSELITRLENTGYESEIGKWYRNCEGRHANERANAQEVIARMKLDGYEVEKEPLYEVIIAGRHLLKLFHGRIDHEFAEKTELCAWAKVAYQLTEQEIKAIDERYWPFAVPVND